MRRYRVITIVLMIMLTAMLIHSNKQKNEHVELIDQYFDLQMQYEKIFTEVQELEEYSHRLEAQVDTLIYMRKEK
jgi:hypothetical protein